MITFPIKKYGLKAPTTVHIEIDESCNQKCRHCYNYWRQDCKEFKKLSKEQLGKIIDELEKNEVFHVIFTGGEPLLNYDVLLFGIKECVKKSMSVSCNTNAILLTEERAKELKGAGLPHMLISLYSFEEDTSNFMTTSTTFEEIKKGIKNAVEAGIKVSINMVISQKNINQIFKTAKLSKELGAQKFHATRLIPPEYGDKKEFELSEKDHKYVMDALVKINKELGLEVGNLVPLPYCFLDNRKYNVVYMHGCPAGTKMMIIGADGETRACNHEAESYGNIFEIGLKRCWDNMKKWRTGELIPKDCKSCPILEKCQGACRFVGKHYFGKLNAKDNLCKGWKNMKIRKRDEGEFEVIDTFGSEVFIKEK